MKWIKIEDKHTTDLRGKNVVCLFADGRISLEPNLYFGQTHYLELPELPKKTLDDEAEHAWESIPPWVNLNQTAKEWFKHGYVKRAKQEVK